jgi:hypothetical protein
MEFGWSKTMNEILKKAESEIYPLTIVSDRYSGTYSGGNFTAWNLDFDEIPEDVNASDVICYDFWLHNEIIVGKGATIQEAVYDLYVKLEEYKKEHNI